MSSSNCSAQACYVDQMDQDDISEYRIERLKSLIELKFGGNKAKCGKALGYRDGAFIGQMLKKKRPITEKTVASVHELPGCGGWFGAAPAQDKQANVVTIERRQCSVDEVLENLETLLAPLATGSYDAVAGALSGMVRDKANSQAHKAAIKAYLQPQAFAEEKRSRK